MESILGSAALGLASAAVQQQFTDKNREADAQVNAAAQARNFVQAQELQRMSPVNTKLGMMAAGLNPNTANVSATPNSVPSAPLATHVSPDVNLSADNNLMSDSRLKNAEAEKIELENDQTRAENESALENYLKQGNSLAQMYYKRGFDEQAKAIEEDLDAISQLKAEGNLNFNVGNLRGAVNAFSTMQAMQERLTNTLDQMLKTETNYRLLVGNKSIDLSKMPTLQREMIEKQIGVQIATASLLMSQKELTDEQKNEVVKLQSKIDNEINLLVEQKRITGYQADQIRNADFKSLLSDGEFVKAYLAKADETQKIILEQVGSLANAYVNAKTGGKIAKSIGNINQTKGQNASQSRVYHYDGRGKLKGHDVINNEGTSSTLKRGIPSVESEW